MCRRTSEACWRSSFRAKCRMPVREAEDKEPISGGTVYFAPPDYHLLVEVDRSLSLSSDEPFFFRAHRSTSVRKRRRCLWLCFDRHHSDWRQSGWGERNACRCRSGRHRTCSKSRWRVCIRNARSRYRNLSQREGYVTRRDRSVFARDLRSTMGPVSFLLVDDLEDNLLSLEALLRRESLVLLKARSGD